ncbi:hypothetical protein [Streptomyces sp. NRRL WC-3742]|uniref:hypothetical protein n=1 Tax=Streptomyces sp. NRRL WC-3742 TaxID=1463934 RepID=UPI0004C6CE3A|nr:hypothetical protein [Streptomyces sp. NRRL WC-3742]
MSDPSPLEALGIFEVPKQLDDRETAIVELFLTAIDAMGGIRAGHQHGLARWFTTGNLTAARPLARTGNPVRYWTTLIQAGELLLAQPSPDPRLTYVLTQCRLNATRAT